MPDHGSMLIPSAKSLTPKREHYGRSVIPLDVRLRAARVAEQLIAVRAYDRYDNVGIAKTVIPAQGQ